MQARHVSLLAAAVRRETSVVPHRWQAQGAGTAATRTQARAAVDAAMPGLVLADIQLADGSSGLDAVDDILKAGSMPVIFITAYPERLLTGDRPEPTYLVTKPFQEATVRAAISQALFFGSTRPL